MFSRIAIAFLIALGTYLPAAAEPFHHPSGEWREYNWDWLAACPDEIDEDADDYYGFSCFASTGGQELNAAGPSAFKLTLFRNRLTGDLDLAIMVAAEGAEVDTARPIMMAFGGGPAQALRVGPDLETRYNTRNQFFVVDADREAELIALMRDRNALEITVPLTGTRGQAQVQLSLRGVLASLDFMATYARRVSQY